MRKIFLILSILLCSIGLFSCDKTVEKTPTSTIMPTVTNEEIVDYNELFITNLN
jgi:hypothetical protein